MRTRVFVLTALALFALALGGGAALAQEATAAALPLMEDELAEQRTPVEVPPPTPDAVRYYRTGHWVWAAGTLLGIAIPLLILWCGVSVALRDVAEDVTRFWPVAAGLFVGAYFLFDWLLSLPFAYYAEFVRQHAYGLSNQTLSRWLAESLLGLGVKAGIAMLFFWLPLLLIRKLPRAWWLATGALTVPFLFLYLFVKPIWLDPLFDDFTAMQNPRLEQQILGLAERAGIDGARVFEVNKSEDTNRVNAYVTGFGATKRIVLWDTLLAKLTPEQVLVVMGHEMGHYVLRHIAIGICAYSALLTVGLALIHFAASAVLHRRGASLRLRALHDPAALPLLLAISGVVLFALMPAAMAYSRAQEHEADRFALEITRDNRACAEAFVAMQATNLGYPRPDAWVKWLRASHPPLGERIDFCNDYRPWERGEPLRYTRLFAE
jgi:Zn-dependent protease with chaperone function